MKKFRKLLLVASASLLLVGCSPSGGETHNEVFNVSFKDYDGKVIYTTQVKYGETAKFVGDLPKIPADLEKCFPFTGWDKSLENVTSDLVLNPTHGEEPNISDFQFVDDCRVFQNAEEFNDETTSYIGYLQMIGFFTFLKEDVEVEGSVKSSIIIDYDDDGVEFDYSKVDLSKEGDYPFTVSVRGFVKKSSIKVVPDSRKWTGKQKKTAGYETYDPNLAGKIDNFYFYDDNKCILDSTTFDEFYPLTYEMVEDNKAVIIRNDDGSIDCKYRINEMIVPYAIEGVKTGVAGVFYDSLQIFTANNFTEVTSEYAYIVARVQDAVFYLTTKYEYNTETKEMKLFAPLEFNTMTYDAEKGILSIPNK